MKKLLLTLFALTVSGFGATTLVQQNLIGPDGLPASGSIVIRSTYPCQSGSDYVGTKSVTYRFTAGNFAVALVPNDTCTPATTYLVTWKITGDQDRNETWSVPSSDTPVTISTVVVSPPPPVTTLIQWPQMYALNLSDGQYCPTVVNHKVTGVALCTTTTTGSGLDATATWASIEAGTAGSGSVVGTTTWAEIEQ